MGKYDGLSTKELKVRLVEAEKQSSAWEKLCKKLNDDSKTAYKDLYAEISELKASVEKAKSEGDKVAFELSDLVDNQQKRIHELSHDLNYEQTRRVSAENRAYDLEQRLLGLSLTKLEVLAIREQLVGLRIDRNGEIA